MKQDVQTALKSMAEGMKVASIYMVRVIFTFALGLAILGLVVFLLVHYVFVVLGALVLAGLCLWFKIELDCARSAREHEEYMKEYRNGKE